MTEFGPNGHIRTDRALRAIAVVLKPGETPEQYENNFKRWLSNKKKVKLSALKDDPEEERRFRQCFAYAMVRDLKYRVRTHPQCSTSRNDPSFQVPGQILKRPRLELNMNNTSPMTGNEGIKSLKVLGAKEWEEDAISCSSSATISEPPLTPRSDVESLETATDPCSSFVKMKHPQLLTGSDGTTFIDQCYATDGAIHVDMEILNSDIYQIASNLLVEADNLKVDSTAQQLIQSTKRIRLNEEAIQDSLNYLESSSTEAAELARQVDELKVALNKEKERRDSVLACVIAHEWKSEENGFREPTGGKIRYFPRNAAVYFRKVGT
ncbi:hypothetical protein V7S43_005073 [Phytophthora oleae]|uniref:Uncharacterized protein n=1 Tax=Phytophthora oleae TaxID=2107226 RepID=A0ABD3FRY4_9STRA